MSLPKVAYFSMEMAIDPTLRIYSGGLGYLSGSHMLSAGQLKLPMVGVTMLWTTGYGEQFINEHNEIEMVHNEYKYSFLKDTGIVVDVNVFGRPVKVKAFLLEPDVFGTVPIYLLTTNIPENSEADRALSYKLYDGDPYTRVSQEIILGVGGHRVLDVAHEFFDVLHLNEGHALPAVFAELDRFGGNIEEVKKRCVFTTHTPISAGNESYAAHFLAEAGFFVNTSVDEAIRIGGEEFSLTVGALRLCRMANGVSQLHGQVANNMWSWVDNRCPIVAITNAVSKEYWQDPSFVGEMTNEQILKAKRKLKEELLTYVAQQTEVKMDPEVLTVVWARRFTAYKRPDLIFTDIDRIQRLLTGKQIQLIFAGKFHPNDETGRQAFNRVLQLSKELPGVAILKNYDLELSAKLKKGSDIWLNTPLRPMEASGTSGMAANMNGSLHFSIHDGWAVEGTFHGLNGFIINEGIENAYLPPEERKRHDYESMMKIFNEMVFPIYYKDKDKWCEMVRLAKRTAETYFHSDRMAIEYYSRLYKPVKL